MTTDSRHDLPIKLNLLARDFTASAPNQKWVGDITYVWTTQGWMYLAVVIDVYSRAVIGWSLQDHMTQELVCSALLMALWRRGFPSYVSSFIRIEGANIVLRRIRHYWLSITSNPA